jgi:hypothetical protein
MLLSLKSIGLKFKTLLPGFLLGILVSVLFFQFAGTAPASYTAVAQTANSPILFHDDFDDGNADGWEVSGGGSWSVVNNEYVVEMGEGTGLEGMAVAGDPTWDNFVYEVDIRGEVGVDKLLMARYVDPENWYALNLRSAPFNDLTLSREEAGTHTILAGVPFENEAGRWYHLTWGFDKRQIQVYMNETLLIDYEDCNSGLANGRIGLLGFTGGWGTDRVVYDNVLVREYPDLRALLNPFRDFVPYMAKEE